MGNKKNYIPGEIADMTNAAFKLIELSDLNKAVYTNLHSSYSKGYLNKEFIIRISKREITNQKELLEEYQKAVPENVRKALGLEEKIMENIEFMESNKKKLE